MRNPQFKLCYEVLRRLHEKGALQHLVLAGSWCLVLYRHYFDRNDLFTTLRTRDMDFLVPVPLDLRNKVDIPALLEDLGFLVELKGSAGYLQLLHPEVMLEFLVPMRGRETNRPFDLPQLGLNAQPLRFMDVALSKTIQLPFEDIPVTAPHPAAFVLHKLLVAPRRASVEKRDKDLNAALMILDLLEKREEIPLVRSLLNGFPRPWRRSILKTLRENHRGAVAELLERG